MFKAALHYFGTRLARPIYGGSGCILALHRVVPEAQRSRLTVNRALEITPEDLDRIIRLLRKRGFEFISMDDVLDRLRSRHQLRFAAFTLDDGYRDNVEYALPVFERHQVPFTVYATRGFSEHRESVWWFSLEEALQSRDRLEVRHRGHDATFPCPDDAAREHAFDILARQVRACRLEERRELLAAIFAPCGVDPLRATRELVLDSNELRALSKNALARLGAHTVHHLTPSVLEKAELRAEFVDCKTWLEELSGKTIRHLAYPFGSANAAGSREFAVAAGCGFATAVTTRCANLFPAHEKAAWALPRLEISGNYAAEAFTERAVSGLLPALRNGGRRVVID